MMINILHIQIKHINYLYVALMYNSLSNVCFLRVLFEV